MSHLRCSRVVPAPRSTVFDYLLQPKNLSYLLEEHIQVDPINMEAPLKVGSEFSFSMSRFGLSQNVRLRIERVVVDQTVTYRQVEGLFAKWVHTQQFENHGTHHCLVTDIVDFQLPFGLVGYLLDDLLIRRDMTRILESRLEKAVHHFEESASKSSEEPPLESSEEFASISDIESHSEEEQVSETFVAPAQPDFPAGESELTESDS